MRFFSSLVVCLVVATFSRVSGRLREFDETCNSYKASENCRPDIDLVCLDNVCSCKEMAFYDPDRKACIALIGESCTPEQTQSYYGRYGYNSYSSYSSYYPTISRCPIDAVCEQRDPNKAPDMPDNLKDQEWMTQSASVPPPHRCLCKRGFYAGEDLDSCVAAQAHNDVCSDELAKNGTACDQLAGLSCSKEGRCVCNQTEGSYYDGKTKRCVINVGGDCNSNTFCEKNTVCSTILDLYKSRYGSTNYPQPIVYAAKVTGITGTPAPRKREDATKKPGKCTCQPGYTSNGQGKCTGSFSVACSTENPCNTDKFLNCVDGLCQCQAGSHQAFSKAANSTCVLLPGAACKIGSGPACSEDSVCAESGLCQCKPGYSETPSGKCLLGHEKECVMSDNRQQYYYRNPRETRNTTEWCNFYQGLSCTGNKCECFDNQLKWDEKRRVCAGGEGERCGSIQMMRTTEFDYQLEPFYPTAYLQSRYTGNMGYMYINSYFVTCAEGHTCTKDHHEVEGWRVCEKAKK